MEEIKVTFETITPIWTGDASGDHKEIRPSSIMGSLRFWFEVICLFGGVTKKEDYRKGILKSDLADSLSREKLLKEIEKNNGKSSEEIKKGFLKQLPLPAQIFGCTGLKSKIRIKSIKKRKEDHSYNYPEGRLQIPSLTYEKVIPRKKVTKTVTPRWFFQKGFQGEFEIVFELEEQILKPFFYPLLTFIEKYGFLGGKWNLGYGRIKILDLYERDSKVGSFRNRKIFLERKKIDLSELVCEKKIGKPLKNYELLKFFLDSDSFYCKKERDFNKKISNIPNNFKVAIIPIEPSNCLNAIKTLIYIKAKIRDCLRPSTDFLNKDTWETFRHQLLGTTSEGNEGNEGNKILPLICEDKVGFISIAGIINTPGRKKEKQFKG